MSGKTTIERIEDLEKQTEEFKSAIQLIVGLSDKINGLANSSRSAELQIGELVNNLKNQADMILTLVHQDRDLQDSLSNLAKTTAAITELLEDKQILTGEALKNKRQESDDKQERRMIDELVQMGAITNKNGPVEPDSLVVLSRGELNTAEPDKTHLLSNCIAVDLASPLTAATLKQDLLGKNLGETVSYVKDSAAGLYSVLTVKEIYAHQSVNVEGELAAHE